MPRKYVCILMVLASTWLLAGCVFKDATWPVIEPVSRTFRFSNEEPLAEVAVIPVKNSDGERVYEIRCGSEFSKHYEFSGLAQCALYSVRPTFDAHDLFHPLPYDSDWETLGRFLPSHLADPCAADPVFGNRRTIDVRGMRVLLVLRQIVPTHSQDPDSRHLALEVSAVNWPGAKRSTAIMPANAPNWFYARECTGAV